METAWPRLRDDQHFIPSFTERSVLRLPPGLDAKAGRTRVPSLPSGRKSPSLPPSGGFLIVGWFEERETAAKRGRPVFGEVPRG
jgi:hypothetical protein